RGTLQNTDFTAERIQSELSPTVSVDSGDALVDAASHNRRVGLYGKGSFNPAIVGDQCCGKSRRIRRQRKLHIARNGFEAVDAVRTNRAREGNVSACSASFHASTSSDYRDRSASAPRVNSAFSAFNLDVTGCTVCTHVTAAVSHHEIAICGRKIHRAACSFNQQVTVQRLRHHFALHCAQSDVAVGALNFDGANAFGDHVSVTGSNDNPSINIRYTNFDLPAIQRLDLRVGWHLDGNRYVSPGKCPGRRQGHRPFVGYCSLDLLSSFVAGSARFHFVRIPSGHPDFTRARPDKYSPAFCKGNYHRLVLTGILTPGRSGRCRHRPRRGPLGRLRSLRGCSELLVRCRPYALCTRKCGGRRRRWSYNDGSRCDSLRPYRGRRDRALRRVRGAWAVGGG